MLQNAAGDIFARQDGGIPILPLATPIGSISVSETTSEAGGIGGVLATPWLFATRYATEQLAELGRHLAASHRPISRDWAARFGIGPETAPDRNHPARGLPPVATGQLQSVSAGGPHLRLVTAPDSPFQKTAIATPFGIVTIRRVTDGRYALRHESDDRLLEHVRKIASEHGRWQPRFRNWLIGPAEIESVAQRLAASG